MTPALVPTILTVAGSDSSGGAGLQADLKAIGALGGYGASVVTALTAQNTTGVLLAEPVSLPMIQAQLNAVFDDLNVVAVKSGMLATSQIIELVAETLATRAPQHYVCDPVMVATSGDRLLDEDAVDTMADRLFPLATVVTPNSHEATALTQIEVTDLASAERAGRLLVSRGARAVLVKGGHLASGRGSDVLVTERTAVTIEGEFIDTPHTHGTGCSYASAIATHLAQGLALQAAVRASKVWLTRAIQGGLRVGRGAGPVNPFVSR